MVKITNDLLLAPDSGLLSNLILLDLSAAFDTIYRNIIRNRLVFIVITQTAPSLSCLNPTPQRFHRCTPGFSIKSPSIQYLHAPSLPDIP